MRLGPVVAGMLLPKLLVIAAVCLQVGASPLSTNETFALGKRIVGGDRAHVSWIFPSIVSFQRVEDDSFLCAGTMIDFDSVLTAASCFQREILNEDGDVVEYEKYRSKDVYVRAGSLVGNLTLRDVGMTLTLECDSTGDTMGPNDLSGGLHATAATTR
jgi:hypothetical protein